MREYYDSLRGGKVRYKERDPEMAWKTRPAGMENITESPPPTPPAKDYSDFFKSMDLKTSPLGQL